MSDILIIIDFLFTMDFLLNISLIFFLPYLSNCICGLIFNIYLYSYLCIFNIDTNVLPYLVFCFVGGVRRDSAEFGLRAKVVAGI